MTRSANINMSFRPDSYWPESLTQEQLIARIKGKARQAIVRNILQTEGFPGLAAFFAREELDDNERRIWGRFHPMFMGGEYLPSMEEGEVEIVRVSLESTTNDQISIRAKRKDGIIFYRVVGEYYDEEAMRYQLPFDQSEEPLTLAKLVQLIDGSRIPDDIYSGGLVIGSWESTFEYDPDVELAVRFVSIESHFYPELADYYATVAQVWKEEHQIDDDEE